MAGRGAGRPHRWSRALAALSVGAAAVAGVAACSPIATDIDYAPSDGARVVLGDEITIENLLILTAAEGDPALVVGAVTNRSGETSTVTLTFGEGIESTVQVAANDTLLLNPANPDGEMVVIDASPVPPGASLPVTVSTEASGSTTAQVAVLDGTLEPYDTYLAYLDDYTPSAAAE